MPYYCESAAGECECGRSTPNDRCEEQEHYTIQEDDLYSCGEYHCGECYPDGPIDAGCDCNECCYDEEYRYGGSSIWPVPVLNYSHKPETVFYSTGGFSTPRLQGRLGKRETFLGMELEVEVNHHAAMEGYALNNAWHSYSTLTERLYCKEDGSLDSGVEMVSHPMTIAAWQELYHGGEFGLYPALAKGGCESRQTCGLHIHVNKSSFRSLAHQARFGILIVRNREAMERVADRSAAYATFVGYDNIASTVRGNSYCPRGAVNFGNRSTIEVRMFASTLDPKRIIGDLEFVHACQTYTRTRPSPDAKNVKEHLTFESFALWLDAHSDRYPFANALVEV